MSAGSIGIEVTANTVAFAGDMGKVAQIAETSMRRVEQAQKIAAQASDKFIQSLKYQTDTFGKTDIEILKYRANLLGASDAAAPLIARLEALKAANVSLDSGGNIKKAAGDMEHLGFQTAGAKRELLVLAHELSQGNFKQFGGSLLVLGERTGAASLLFSGLGLSMLGTVAVLGSFAFAAYKGAEESNALAKSIQLTGGYAGQTESSFNALSKAIAGETTHNIGAARDALAALGATGKITGTALGSLGAASVELSRLTGKSAEEIAADFAHMSDGAAKYAATLNESYHFLTAAQYEHIRTLEEEGRKQEAMAETGKLITAALKENEGNLGSLQRTLRAVSSTWHDFWDAAFDMGRKETIADKLKKAQTAAEQAQAGGQARSSLPNLTGIYKQAGDEQIALVRTLNGDLLRETNLAMDKSAAAQAQAVGIEASKRLEAFSKKYASQKQQADAEVKLYKDAISERIAAGQGGVDSESKQQATIAAIRASYEKKSGAKPRSADTSILDGALKQDEFVIAQEKQIFDQRAKNVEFLYKNNITTDKEYQAARKAIEDEYVQNSITAYDAELSILKNYHNRDAKERSDNSNKAAAIEEKKRALISNVAEKAIQDSFTESVLAPQREYNRLLDEAAAIKATASNIEKRIAIDEQVGITSQLDGMRKISDARKIELAELEEVGRKLGDVALANPMNRTMQKQTEEFATALRKVAADADVLKTHLDGIESTALTNFFDSVATGSKTVGQAFGDFAKQIINDLIKMQAQAAATSILGGGGGGFLSGIFKAISGGGGGGDMGPLQAAGSTPTGFADGGNPPLNVASMVGERGPELFVPRGAGTIIPNDQLGGGGGGGSVTVSNVYHIDSRTDLASIAQIVEQGGKRTEANIKRELMTNGQMRKLVGA